MKSIRIFNSLSGEKEDFVPLHTGHVRMYGCGVTTYDHCHIGHAMQAVFFDMIRNYLEICGYQVTYVRNFTDVDDKIIHRAKEQNISPKALADQIVQSTKDDMLAIGIRPATHEPRVSETIPEIIAMVQQLIDNGYAYPTADGDVYFRVAKKENYGCLSHRRIEELKSGTREIVKGDKEDELDFVLWKSDQTEGGSWASPWGQGRPGWHIECSAMSKKFLGDYFDIHGGGRDLVFPHHENEIAQSEAANNAPYVKIWMHSGLLTINGQKMSKSLGNHILISDFLSLWPKEVLRFAFLSQHYRSNVDFSEGFFKRCAQRLLYYYESLLKLQSHASNESAKRHPELDNVVKNFHEAMRDDFNSCRAIGALNQGFKLANELAKKPKSLAEYGQDFAKVLSEQFQIFGLLGEEPKAFIQELKMKVLPTLGISAKEIDELIQKRNDARQAKDFAKSDGIRKQLDDLGISLMDTPEGTSWTLSLSSDQDEQI